MAEADPDPELRAIVDGVLGDPDKVFTLDGAIVARWVGSRLAVVLSLRLDEGAQPGSEWDAFPAVYEKTPQGDWVDRGAGGYDYPAVPGTRPSLAAGDPPVWLASVGIAGRGPIVTFGVAAEEVASIDIHTPDGVTRSEVGHFGAVVVATESAPAELVAIGHDGVALTFDVWPPNLHLQLQGVSSRFPLEWRGPTF